jgi:hypothetical protein
LTFTPEGSESLRRATGERIGEELGIVIDGELVFHAVIVEPFGHEAVITCVGLSREELSGWVTRLNAKARRRVLRKISRERLENVISGQPSMKAVELASSQGLLT